MKQYLNFPLFLFLVFVIVWIILAIEPLYRPGWLVENIVIFISVPIVLLSYWKFRLSNVSYVLIFIFSILPILGAHYTYSYTPWGDWISALFDLERNHYDRVVHFLYGMLMIPVFTDLLRAYLPKQMFMRGLLLVSVIITAGTLYEIAEFIAGITLSPEIGLAFLGFQGDIWDTQKDMVFLILGALLGLLVFLPFWRNRFHAM